MEALTESISEDGNVTFSDLPVEALTLFEDISYAMNRYADPSVPEDIDEWLDSFETFDIYTIFPQILDLWEIDNRTTTTAKKKSVQRSEK